MPSSDRVKYCSSECQSRGPGSELQCPGCGESFIKSRSQTFCTRECAARSRCKALFPKPRSESYLTRAERFGVEYEVVERRKVYERDNWICGICDSAVDQELKYPDLMSASLDHVVPLAAGGPHKYDNVQCSHWICNVLKGAKQPSKVSQ